VTYVYGNLLGNEAGRAIYDGGAMIASGGTMLAVGPRFGLDECLVTSAIVDVDATRTSQARIGSFRPAVDRDANCVCAPFRYPDLAPSHQEPTRSSWESSGFLKEEEFTRALALALFDYLRKSRSNGYVVSLSGGADSSAVACLVALMVRMGCSAIGLDAFRQRLGYAGLQATDERGLVRELLTCVYQGTENSSETTRNAARHVAEAIHAGYLEFDVDGLTKDYVALVERGIGRRLTWETDDIALQNIQARVRGPGIWLLANLRNAILLATSNRSEAAVGYATMDGDTCGGLSPIAGIDKAFLRDWLRWMETRGPDGVGPIPGLGVVNEQVPTAELRPLASRQTDEADLMPYDVLEAIEEAVIGEKRTPVECFQLLRVRFAQHPPRKLGEWVGRFLRLWCRNQWKRERYAPSFHVDDKNLDPRTWCRFPILSGGFRRELEELKSLVDKL
jgi:NAD+ synthase (glutamine-hydrolysing)